MERFGKFELTQLIGFDDDAEVFLARRRGAGDDAQELVVRRILPELAADPEAVADFLAKAEVAGRVDHPSVVRVLDRGEAEGRAFVASEAVRGDTLAVMMRRASDLGVRIPAHFAVRIVAGLCGAIEQVHRWTGSDGRSGLTHPEIGKDTVVVELDGAVKLVALGVVEGGARKADVAAAGALLFELTVGAPPAEPLVPPPADADLPPELARVVTRAAGGGYDTARELQLDLEGFLQSQARAVGPGDLGDLVASLRRAEARDATRIERWNDESERPSGDTDPSPGDASTVPPPPARPRAERPAPQAGGFRRAEPSSGGRGLLAAALFALVGAGVAVAAILGAGSGAAPTDDEPDAVAFEETSELSPEPDPEPKAPEPKELVVELPDRPTILPDERPIADPEPIRLVPEEIERKAAGVKDAGTTPAPPPDAQLSVRSNIAGALVQVDGVRLGETPLARAPVAPGAHVVEVRAGPAIWKQRASFEPGRHVDLEIALEAGILVIEGAPPEASCAVDRRPIPPAGLGRIVASTGPLDVHCAIPGREPLKARVVIERGRTATLDLRDL